MKIQITILLMFCFFRAFSQEEQETKVLKGNSKVKTKMDFDLKGFHVGILPSADAIIGPLSKEWGSKKEGIGFFQGYGGRLEIGKSLNDNNIAFIGIGQETWKVARRMIANDVVIKNVESKLKAMPIMIGFKHYNKKMIFLSPSIGVQLLKLTSKNLDEIEELIGKGNRLSGDLKLGKQKELKICDFEFGIQYKLIYSQNFYGISSPIHQLGFFGGIIF